MQPLLKVARALSAALRDTCGGAAVHPEGRSNLTIGSAADGVSLTTVTRISRDAAGAFALSAGCRTLRAAIEFAGMIAISVAASILLTVLVNALLHH